MSTVFTAKTRKRGPKSSPPLVENLGRSEGSSQESTPRAFTVASKKKKKKETNDFPPPEGDRLGSPLPPPSCLEPRKGVGAFIRGTGRD